MTETTGRQMFDELIRLLRRRNQFNVTTLARAIKADATHEVSRRTLHRWIAGDTDPHQDQVEALARAAGVDLAYIYPTESELDVLASWPGPVENTLGGEAGERHGRGMDSSRSDEQNLSACDTREGGGEKLLTAAEVADALRVSEMTVYRLIKNGELAALRVGKSYRIRRGDLEAYLEAAVNQAQRQHEGLAATRQLIQRLEGRVAALERAINGS